MKHVGLSAHRTKDNLLEKRFATAWDRENNPPSFLNGGHGVLQHLLCSKGDGIITRELTEEEIKAAATVVQWLGSPVGYGFLESVLGDRLK